MQCVEYVYILPGGLIIFAKGFHEIPDHIF